MNIIFLGKPGAGKGLHSELIAKQYNLHHFSTGDLFRKQMNKNTKLGKEVKSYMNSANLVPDEIVNKVVAEEVKIHNYENIIFDGYPRTLPQAEFLDKELKISIDHIKLLDIPDNIAIKRIQDRQKINPRTESNSLERVKDRITEFNKLTLPVIDKYKKEGRLKIVNGNNTIESVSNKINNIIGGK